MSYGLVRAWRGGLRYYLVESPRLAVPLLDAVECRFSGEVKHEEDGHCIVADEGQHVDEFALATEIPNREGDCCPPHGDCFFHEVDACTPKTN